MDVSKQDALGGKELIQTVAALTGLPMDLIQNELKQIIESNGYNAEKLTLDEFRNSMLAYLDSFNPDQAT